MASLQTNSPADADKGSERAKKHYSKPTLSPLGSVSSLTLGHGGSTIDGNHTYSQRGRGNDEMPNPH